LNTIQTILIIVTSFGQIALNEPTGVWLEEFAVPYQEFQGKGFKIIIASPQGGKAPIDPRSNPTPEQKVNWTKAIEALENTLPLASIDPEKFDAVFIPGGHGTMFDFPNNKELHRILQSFAEKDKVIAAMCHGPASFVGVTLKEGTPLVAGKTITSFTNEEETESGFKNKMPFLLESRLRDLGANFIEKPNWSDHVQIDGKLITGQNPQSSKSTALAVINTLNRKQAQKYYWIKP
jgi:putative intracellular protease/amidase